MWYGAVQKVEQNKINHSLGGAVVGHPPFLIVGYTGAHFKIDIGISLTNDKCPSPCTDFFF